MKRIAMIAAAAAFALASTSALAGGFKYGSVGGNVGTWTYGDAAAGGDAKIIGLGYGKTSSESYAGSDSTKTYGFGYKSVGKSVGTYSASGNRSSFKGFGIGYAQSGSSAVAGSGIGHGFGFKAGSVGVGGKGKR